MCLFRGNGFHKVHCRDASVAHSPSGSAGGHVRDNGMGGKLAVLTLLLGTSIGLTEEIQPNRMEQRGRAIAETMCSGCHAIGKRGRSPHIGAPAFRALDSRLDLDTFAHRLRRGLTSGHPDMPTFRFTREDARDFILYLKSIQVP
jgi:cytochrome c